nr:exopolysaccharide biosynthesis protein [Devosia faecipullorum]
MRRVAESDAPRLSFDRLIEAMGRHSHRLVILVLTLLNMIPGPPGFGGTIAWTTFAVALFMVLGRPIRLPAVIGDRKLPLGLLLKASEQVARVTAIIARFSRPRLRWLTGAAATLPYGVFTMILSVFMTLPIPFINAIPNIGLCIIAFSMLNRDGLGVVIGLVICTMGLLVAGALLTGVFHLGMAAVDAVT